MNIQTMTLQEIRRAGIRALARDLGPLGMVRFLQQFEIGLGDYSKERHELLDQLDAQGWADKILEARESNPE